jgi:PTH2 family peptidyl-tRNA hydrolase
MKQVIVMRADLNMSRGKIAAQACHGSLGAFKKADDRTVKKWESEGEKKVVLKVKDLVHDAGHTELPKSTITCLGIGPDDDEKIDKITQDLKLLK